MSLQKRQQIRRRTLLELGRAAAGPGALGHAMLPRPGLVVGLAHGAAGGRTRNGVPSSSMKFLQHDQFSASLMSNTGPIDSQP